jgi:hypothetical protein
VEILHLRLIIVPGRACVGKSLGLSRAHSKKPGPAAGADHERRGIKFF